MLRLSDDVYERTLTLIERYDLHGDHAMLPVPIKQVAKEEGWCIKYHPKMGQAAAMAFVVGPVRLMYVNCNLSFAAQQQAIAHEMGHILAGHGVSLDTFMTFGHEDEGIRSAQARQELEANIVGAMLLIPEYLRDAPMSDRELADECGVNNRAVRLFRSMVPRQDGLLEMIGAD
jgi:Zn-dependent peptidase ImmA (M78 family)